MCLNPLLAEPSISIASHKANPAITQIARNRNIAIADVYRPFLIWMGIAALLMSAMLRMMPIAITQYPWQSQSQEIMVTDSQPRLPKTKPCEGEKITFCMGSFLGETKAAQYEESSRLL